MISEAKIIEPMDRKALSLFLGISCLFPIVMIGWSIRDYWDKSEYIKLTITIAFTIILFLLARYFIKYALRREK